MFVAEFFHEGEFEFLAVEIPLEIEKVGFDTEMGRGVLEGGTVADVQDGLMASLAGFGEDGIDAVRRKGEAGDVEVGGGEAELAAQFVAAEDFSGK